MSKISFETDKYTAKVTDNGNLFGQYKKTDTVYAYMNVAKGLTEKQIIKAAKETESLDDLAGYLRALKEGEE